MTIERFKARISGIGLEFHQVEKILTQAVRARHLSVGLITKTNAYDLKATLWKPSE